ncbi:hypothetical protein SERLA73DRAFT_176838 [Serpula lacrymans var. lacrymans S7.3]|uniref:Uncharacterized protein n=2 Tax=Serpula lacrymans var. lacrymans TaxID=341189 RepID=F8PQ58_SERL3|nr:uncharacterized protein SERLADRAFT_460116 [Serpula lacrymans var. lacrymans S7.9]EGO01523.1 hypothetical protein SERLA73DRAFT_176838 [Serpula lacrymans var. lacrymans S7.3]EGO27178.1 hypothetical protein SERLADRAFT_460116 [Serpula lacrymans var. lacrymans S7.9]
MRSVGTLPGQPAERRLSLRSARKESMYRRAPQPLPRQASSKKGSNKVKVSQWILLINRINTAGRLRDVKAPSRIEIDMLASHGCSYIDNEAGELSFSREWTHDEVDTYLRRIFPSPFEYVDNYTKGKTTKSAWVLMAKENRKIALVPKDKPSGKDLYHYRGLEKSSTGNTRVMCHGMCLKVGIQPLVAPPMLYIY